MEIYIVVVLRFIFPKIINQIDFRLKRIPFPDLYKPVGFFSSSYSLKSSDLVLLIFSSEFTTYWQVKMLFKILMWEYINQSKVALLTFDVSPWKMYGGDNREKNK